MRTSNKAKLLVLSLMLLSTQTFAQAYPAKPIRVIDAYPPGGSTDIVARIISPRFAESTGHAWVIENRPGAQGIIGTDFVSKAAPDGYTLLMFTGSHTIHPSVYKNLPYDLVKAFAPVTQTTLTTNILVVHPSLPVNNLKELIALATRRPGQLNYSSAGTGSSTHMAMELLKSMAKIDIAHIPYKGSAPAVIDCVAGHVALLFGPMPGVVPHVRSGRLRPLAVSTVRRSIALPEIPTVAEAGVQGYESTNSVGVLAPAGSPREIVNKLNQEIVRVLNLPDVRDRLHSLGSELVGSTPEQFGEFIRSEIVKWARVVQEARIPVQPW